MKTLYLSLLISFLTASVYSQQVVELYPEDIKNHQPSDEQEIQNNGDNLWIRQVQVPTLEVFLPAKANATGKAIVVCPGGGYEGLAYDWEGTDIAKWLNSKGIAAFVLKYRLPNSASVQEGRLAPLQDAQRAIRLVRSHAEEWNVETDQVGIMGFSAGGHLASTLSTHYDFEDDRFFDSASVDTIDARPDFSILVYPVISMDPDITHSGSRNSLIGNDPSDELVRFYSNELQVTVETPPTFIVHSTDDDVVPVENSLRYYEALRNQEVYAEMHIYPYGGHGYSLGIDRGGHLQGWTERLSEWLDSLDQ